ncbi:helix-turn-helix domain-containing protein [Halanaerobacter jeridensis]|uniref:Transcriptional regulator with XRE-family HTH domain n=1 Tax=Halanaerobacter jeridensis TaxID=706427 RepID=A0A939BPZ1_9FIRM|nr:transcriptional regulator with XRE-family HTH domain [Halanaerobacter jeridensis]
MIKKHFDNNKAAFARKIGVSRTTVSKVIKRKKAGSKFFGGLMKLCDEKGLNYRDYIYLDSTKEED